MTVQTSEQLLTGYPTREFILIAGKDGVGKTSALLSLARYAEALTPEAKFYLIDTENKVKSTLRGFGADAPKNLLYYKCDDMNAVTGATAEVLKLHKRGDWLGVESLSRVWERSQDLAYQAQAGTTKVEYLERKRKSPIPGNVGDFWAIAKGAHDSAFFDLLTTSDSLNVICTTTVAKPPKEGFVKESADRKAVRFELGIDVGLEGAPRIPYYVETLAMLELKQGNVSCRMLRDNLSALEQSRIEFDGFGRKEWAFSFYSECRG